MNERTEKRGFALMSLFQNVSCQSGDEFAKIIIDIEESTVRIGRH